MHLLSDVNVCHVFYNKLTYLLTYLDVRSFDAREKSNVSTSRRCYSRPPAIVAAAAASAAATAW